MDPQVFGCKIKIPTFQKAPYYPHSPFLAACDIFLLTKTEQIVQRKPFSWENGRLM